MKKKWMSLLIVLVLITNISISAQVIYAVASENGQEAFKDIPKNWASDALENAIDRGFLSGYNNLIMPDEYLTRAQLATVINRILGATKTASLNHYIDVSEFEWYYSDMAKAVQMKTFVGAENRLNPNQYISREEVFVVLTRAFKLNAGDQELLSSFVDHDLVSEWAKDATASLVLAGYVRGAYEKLNPKGYITRAEFAQIIDNMIKKPINKAGVYTEDIEGNVIINVPDVTLKGMKINGDLVIGDGVGDGDITLDSVVITGRTVIRGGGINSVKIIGDSNVQNIIVARVDGQVRVFTEEGIEIGEVIIDGNDDVILEGNTGTVTVTASNITVIATNAKINLGIVEGDHSKIIVSMDSSVQRAEINGEDSQVIVEKGSTIDSIVVNGNGADVSGEGEVGNVEARADNIKVSTPGTKVTANEGTQDVLAGTRSVNEGNTETVPKKEIPKRGSGSNRNNGSGDISVSDITLSGEGNITTITSGASLQMNVSISPDNATNKTITWRVETLVDGSAIIDPVTGLLTATGAGTVRVTATNVDSGISGTLVITITPALEAETPDEYFTFDSSTGTITGYDRAGGLDVIIPSTIKGVAVEHIGDFAFSASGGKGDDMPGLTSVVIPNSVISIGEGAFYRNALSTISIPDGVTHIGDYAFNSNEIVEVNLSRSVESIGDYVFEECSQFEAFNVDANNSHYSSDNGVLFNNDKSTLIQYPYAKAGNYSIPSSVTRIEDEAFMYCTELTGVDMSEGLTDIGNYAFSECTRLTSITLPDSITDLGYSVFYYCTGLTSVTIGNGIDSISDGLFSYSGLESIIIPDNVTSIGNYAFSECSKLLSVTIPNNVTSIGEYAFNGCRKLSSLDIPDNITIIEDYAFSGCSELTEIIIPNGVTNINGAAFSYCYKLEDVTIPNTVISIGQGAFTSTGLTSITIPDSVTSIGRSAFSNCSELTGVNISNNVTNLEENTFYNCSKLESIIIPDNITSIGNNAFSNCTTLTTVRIGEGVAFGDETFIGNFKDVYNYVAGIYDLRGDTWEKREK